MDTKTREILCSGFSKFTATATDDFSLLLLRDGADQGRINTVLASLEDFGTANSTSYPFVKRQGLSLDEAVGGQFALACCDCVSAFLRDEQVSQLSPPEFAQLYVDIMSSREFETVDIQKLNVPAGEDGNKFRWQFFGMALEGMSPEPVQVTRIKARLMQHCLESIGGYCQFG